MVCSSAGRRGRENSSVTFKVTSLCTVNHSEASLQRAPRWRPCITWAVAPSACMGC
ncbi:hypothetical protein QIT82_gp14 [Pseudomonas phage psageK9]|uniref:Uncharacterized protein n=1 Tax=Pseudomonas phage psageK9 TaxID=2875722 RepID=A0AAE8XMF7_9CAUD|nr:hypothetical protein QIT82_gp14 [Pseudomonas phage psageK9]QXV71594.1 hypothetical protein psageB2_017 [Pseudomonas phage psageB2]UAW53884.1 hypothetical protein psageK9_14 [Pseudomonas phage psageK9]